MRKRHLHLKKKYTTAFGKLFQVIASCIHILIKILTFENQFIIIPNNFLIDKPTVFIKLMCTLAGFFKLYTETTFGIAIQMTMMFLNPVSMDNIP